MVVLFKLLELLNIYISCDKHCSTDIDIHIDLGLVRDTENRLRSRYECGACDYGAASIIKEAVDIASGYGKATAADIQKANTLFNESVNQ